MSRGGALKNDGDVVQFLLIENNAELAEPASDFVGLRILTTRSNTHNYRRILPHTTMTKFVRCCHRHEPPLLYHKPNSTRTTLICVLLPSRISSTPGMSPRPRRDQRPQVPTHLHHLPLILVSDTTGSGRRLLKPPRVYREASRGSHTQVRSPFR
jgi:hypothetical protein